MELISVIVPIYKVEKYLNRCIKSIVQQTYKCLDIILVDDGSPDQCPDICDAWAKRDSRIRVIHKQNGGLSDARNVGLSVATGNYIAFVDSDDWIHEQYVEQLYRAIKEQNVSISACDVRWVYTETQNNISCNPVVQVYETEQALNTLINGKIFRAVVWNKLYHRDLLHGEQFEIGRYHEDEFFTYRILGKVQKMAFINVELYYYFQREGSIMNSISYKHLDSLDAYVERIRYFESNFPKLYKIDKIKFCVACINFYQECFKLDDKDKKQCMNKIKLCRKKVTFNIKEWKNYSIKDWFFIIGSRFFIGFMSYLLNLRKKSKNGNIGI